MTPPWASAVDRLRGCVCVLALAVLAAVACAPAAGAVRSSDRRRTDPRSDYAYRHHQAPPVAGDRVVVHYVRRGRDAPPHGDADGDGIPDYVQWATRAADLALEYYEQPRFCPPAVSGCVTFRGFRPPK